MQQLFELVAALLTLSALFAWLNQRFWCLPENIALLIAGLGASLLLIGIDYLLPASGVFEALAKTLERIDFHEALMDGMLGFLLFAGALHVDLGRLRSRALFVGILATVGVAISTFIVASGFWAVAQLADLPLDFAWALVLGAIVAPTDPVAVLSTLRSLDLPDTLKTDLTGEALFNDGIAVVFFIIALRAATGSAGEFGPIEALNLLLLEAGGGALLGLVTGYVAYRAIRAIDNYSIEVMISLALVAGTYSLANKFHLSGPISVVVAGVLIGNRGASHGMSDLTKRYVFGFWTLVDDVLNAVLFLLIGIEIVTLKFSPLLLWAGLAIPLVLAARFAAVGAPVAILKRWTGFAPGTVPVLTWAGIRGGISVALALSLPAVPARPLILAATYCVVLFTVVVQGLSLEWVLKRAVDPPRP